MQVIDQQSAIVVSADDIFVLARSSAVFSFAYVLDMFSIEIRRWETEYSLDISYDKCCYTTVPSQRKYSNELPLVIWIDGHKRAFRWRLKYLGITFDANLSWKVYLDSIQEKAFQGSV